jgi:hypothetical protein
LIDVVKIEKNLDGWEIMTDALFDYYKFDEIKLAPKNQEIAKRILEFKFYQLFKDL